MCSKVPHGGRIKKDCIPKVPFYLFGCLARYFLCVGGMRGRRVRFAFSVVIVNCDVKYKRKQKMLKHTPRERLLTGMSTSWITGTLP